MRVEEKKQMKRDEYIQFSSGRQDVYNLILILILQYTYIYEYIERKA